MGAPLIAVLAPERCSPVDAVTKLLTEGSQLPLSLTRLVQPILPAVVDALAMPRSKTDQVDQAIHMNVRHVVRGLRETSDPNLAEPRKAGKLKVLVTYYNRDNGVVDFFDRG